ncbi:uncharacterized protein LOC123684924 [Harmonia axyridis]|uniref:uncharacterized protein LOC123684924 n=1 Tax=Harmonia axyridis TaxID=115357 RepID=UPI001E277D5C|nr:uncharacterized protein LOC123684924 [Harmonia axyridis]
MWFLNLLILLLIKVNNGQRNVPGKITGIPSSPHEVLMQEFKPKIEALKIILTKEVENMDRQIRLAQNLVQDNIITSRSIASQKIKELKSAIAAAKEEAKYASPEVKLCVSMQEHESPKSFVVPTFNCFSNNAELLAVKTKIGKLQTITSQLLSNCQQLHMDDSDKDVNLLRKCLTEKSDDTYRHISRFRDEYDAAFGNVIKKSLQCFIQGNFETFKGIGGVMSNLRNCKNFNNYRLQKLP